MGRLGRTGQDAERISTWYYAHVPEIAAMVDKAVMRAQYVETTMRTPQSLLAGLMK